jgi:sec-independent protein translocase protein TatA
MPFDIHPVFLIGLLVLVLIIFGPGKLPQVGSALGRGLREFRHATTAIQEQVAGEGDRNEQTGSEPVASDRNEDPAKERVVGEQAESGEE